MEQLNQEILLTEPCSGDYETRTLFTGEEHVRGHPYIDVIPEQGAKVQFFLIPQMTFERCV